eukprot:c6299_g1_i1.p1 GENE.c6299_g1_i1~~c6299_g1_i1.p1  ORF type:complete len:359 (+),score=80.33 c6299_g1_i1:39-1115(+)
MLKLLIAIGLFFCAANAAPSIVCYEQQSILLQPSTAAGAQNFTFSIQHETIATFSTCKNFDIDTILRLGSFDFEMDPTWCDDFSGQGTYCVLDDSCVLAATLSRKLSPGSYWLEVGISPFLSSPANVTVTWTRCDSRIECHENLTVMASPAVATKFNFSVPSTTIVSFSTCESADVDTVLRVFAQGGTTPLAECDDRDGSTDNSCLIDACVLAASINATLPAGEYVLELQMSDFATAAASVPLKWLGCDVVVAGNSSQEANTTQPDQDDNDNDNEESSSDESEDPPHKPDEESTHDRNTNDEKVGKTKRSTMIGASVLGASCVVAAAAGTVFMCYRKRKIHKTHSRVPDEVQKPVAKK